MRLLGIPLFTGTQADLLARIRLLLCEPGFHRVATVNPEFLVLATRNQAFQQALLAADVCVADGVGIVLALLLHGERVTRFPGVDLLHQILLIAEKENHAVFLAIRSTGLSAYEEICVALLKKYPKLKLESKILQAHIVLCNFGAPAQEFFLEGLREESRNSRGAIRLVIGVGGSFDYLTGKLKRAPQWLRAIGLEWLWRLMLQPKRWKRIWNAVVIFPVKVLFQR